jgi:competence protein ComFB
VDIQGKYDLENLENRGLKIVVARLGTFLEERPEFCRCEQCVFDLLAFTLNHVTPLYGTSLLGPLSGNTRLLDKIAIEIEMALEDGARRVARNPGHVEEART